MITKFESFKLTEASVFPMKEYSVSHVTSWLTSKYKNQFENLLMKNFGVKLSKNRNGNLIVDQGLEHICQERGIEILKPIEGLSITVRSIHSTGSPWIQILGSTWIKMPDDELGKPVYSMSTDKLGSLVNFSYNDCPAVIKNLEDVSALQKRAVELYGQVDKKGYNKEIGEIAKDLQFKIIWDLSAINTISKYVLNGLKEASVKQWVRNQPRKYDKNGQVLDYDYENY